MTTLSSKTVAMVLLTIASSIATPADAEICDISNCGKATSHETGVSIEKPKARDVICNIGDDECKTAVADTNRKIQVIRLDTPRTEPAQSQKPETAFLVSTKPAEKPTGEVTTSHSRKTSSEPRVVHLVNLNCPRNRH